MNKKLLILKVRNDSYKLKRLSEEAQKKELSFDVINCFSLGSQSARIEDNVVNFNDYSFVLSLDNQTYCNYFINSFGLRKISTWPNFFVLRINDKFLQAQFLDSIGTKHPKTILVDTLEENDLRKKVLDSFGSFPCIIKKVTGSLGHNVAKVDNASEIIKFIDAKSGEVKLMGKSSYLLQEFIEEACGEDYRVLMLNGRIIGGMKRKTSNSAEFRANIALGGTSSVFEIPQEVEIICMNIFKNSKSFYLGIDLIKRGEDWYVIELNSCAQFEGFEKATGINVAGKIIDEIAKIIKK